MAGPAPARGGAPRPTRRGRPVPRLPWQRQAGGLSGLAGVPAHPARHPTSQGPGALPGFRIGGQQVGRPPQPPRPVVPREAPRQVDAVAPAEDILDGQDEQVGSGDEERFEEPVAKAGREARSGKIEAVPRVRRSSPILPTLSRSSPGNWSTTPRASGVVRAGGGDRCGRIRGRSRNSRPPRTIALSAGRGIRARPAVGARLHETGDRPQIFCDQVRRRPGEDPDERFTGSIWPAGSGG
jgi:hypothetical protein